MALTRAINNAAAAAGNGGTTPPPPVPAAWKAQFAAVMAEAPQEMQQAMAGMFPAAPSVEQQQQGAVLQTPTRG